MTGFAAKMLLPHLLEEPGLRERFANEALVAASLDHPAILPVYAVGESGGVPFFTMKLVAGGSLADRLVEQGEERLIHGVEQGVFPINFAIQVATTDDGQLQNILMDAFDEGLVTTKNFAQARQIITARARSSRNKSLPAKYTVTQLRQDIAETTLVMLWSTSPG